MYFVDRNKIEQTLKYIERNIENLDRVSISDPIHQYALERIAHMTIESIIDVGNDMIDGFIMRDPGSYEDIIDILLDEKVISSQHAEGLKEIISYRKELVQNYLQVNHERILQSFTNYKEILNEFPEKVRKYLDEELGPVTAFKN